jgi:hypothetical protein
MAADRNKKRSISGFLLRHWAWLIVLGLLISSGLTGYRIYKVGLPEGTYMFASIATNLVVIALVLSVRYIIIENLMRGIRKGMEQPSAKDDPKADQVASSVGRTTGRYAGIAGRALSQGARKVGRVARAGAATVRQAAAERASDAEQTKGSGASKSS